MKEYFASVWMDVNADTNVAVVLLDLYTPDAVIHAQGTSRRAQGDKSDPNLGVDLAVARALASAGNRLLRQCSGRVRHADFVRECKAAHKDTPPMTDEQIQKRIAATKARTAAAKAVDAARPKVKPPRTAYDSAHGFAPAAGFTTTNGNGKAGNGKAKQLTTSVLADGGS